MTLKNLQIDHYPFHRACVGRDHWVRYQEPNGDRVPWVEEMQNTYAKKVAYYDYLFFLVSIDLLQVTTHIYICIYIYANIYI